MRPGKTASKSHLKPFYLNQYLNCYNDVDLSLSLWIMNSSFECLYDIMII